MAIAETKPKIREKAIFCGLFFSLPQQYAHKKDIKVTPIIVLIKSYGPDPIDTETAAATAAEDRAGMSALTAGN